MNLTFYTHPQCMTFVDPITNQLVAPGQLQPGTVYTVFAVIQNGDSVEYKNVVVEVVHSAFGIGLPGGSTYIVQPGAVNVPPAFDPSHPGLATIQFQFIAPAGGHGCLVATILASNAKLNQNVTVLTAPAGVASTISFLVFANPTFDETMFLTLEQRFENGALVAVAHRWPDQWVAPAALTPTNQTADAVMLHIPRGNTYYSIGININIPANATEDHVFFVRGTVNGLDVGSVSLVVKPEALFVKPHPYVIEGYESPDIVLIDPKGKVVPLFGNPATETILLPNTDYTMRVTVHNSSPTDAVNTVVRMWEVRGGWGMLGTADVQTTTVPGHGFVVLTSNRKFHSGPIGTHSCAVVSLYNALSDNCTTDWVGAWVPPMQTGVPGPYAMRNTDSALAFLGKPWEIHIVATLPFHIPPREIPLEFTVDPVLIPHGWEKKAEVAEAVGTLEAAGNRVEYPAYLLPKLLEKFEKLDLDIEVKAEGAEIEVMELVAATKHGPEKPTPASHYRLLPKQDRPIALTIAGKLPRNAKDGDIILVRCAAKYPRAEGTPMVQFTEALHVIQG